MQKNLYDWLKANGQIFSPVIKIDLAKEKIIEFDLSEKNTELAKIDIDNVDLFCSYINDLLKKAGAKFGFGGYDELRAFYSRSDLFATNEIDEPRRLHIGLDIWGNAETEIFAPCDGTIHSFAFNDNFGDYGATIILKHQFDPIIFYTLYGHLSVADLKHVAEGDKIQAGQEFAHFGRPEENGHWPPHLHFQIINNIGDYKGDYPGVCKLSERKRYIENCPDPELILKIKDLFSNNII